MAKKIGVIKHKKAKRKNIPTAELESVMEEAIKKPIQIAYERRNTDLDPQLIWRGKEKQDEDPFNVSAPPLYIQEKVQPKAIIEDLCRDTKMRAEGIESDEPKLFNDFNGLSDIEAVTEFYKHDQNWSNRMICGDSMSVMASLSEREGLRGKVQCIYIDPPYGIKFNSNFQWSTTSRDVRDGLREHFTNEPEQVKAFRDTWSDGIHTYLSYLRDRLIVARDLLSESGSVFVQIGDENVHRVRSMMDEVFGEDNFVSLITVTKTSGHASSTLPNVTDYLIWFARKKESVKYHQPYQKKELGGKASSQYRFVKFPDGTIQNLQQDGIVPEEGKIFRLDNLKSQSVTPEGSKSFNFEGVVYPCGANLHWKTSISGLHVLAKAGRLFSPGIGKTLSYLRGIDDFAVYRYSNIWTDTGGGAGEAKAYVVQTANKVIQRCLLMTTDPGDLVLDPTCGSGTTAYVAEQWGRRWITIDTSRVALALARSRLMGARYLYYILEDTPQGREKAAEIFQTPPKTSPTNADIKYGFVYERIPHITLKSIASNSEIDVIWEQAQPAVETALNALNNALKSSAQSFKVETGARIGKVIDFNKNKKEKLPSGETVPHNKLLEWEVPRVAPQEWNKDSKAALKQFWKDRIQRQNEIDKSIAARADFEYLYDKPFVDKSKIRVAGPFTVESLSPHRNLAVDQNDELIDEMKNASKDSDIAKVREPAATEFASIILDEIKRVGVQQASKEDHINFSSIIACSGGGGG